VLPAWKYQGHYYGCRQRSLPLPPRRRQAVATKLQAVAAKLPPPSCRRHLAEHRHRTAAAAAPPPSYRLQAASAKLLPLTRHRQAAAPLRCTLIS